MLRSISLRLVPLMIISALLLGGCGLFTPRPRPATPTMPAVLPQKPMPTNVDLPEGAGGNLIMTLGYQDPPTLDPALVGDVTSAFVVSQLFSGLVKLDNELNVQPDLAQYWNVSEDGLTYTFQLRYDAHFADGKELTSRDVRYALERATDPDLAAYLPAHTYLGDIVGVKEKLAGKADEIRGIILEDEYTIAITIDSPKSYFLAKLAHPVAYVVDRDAVEKGGASWTENPNGSGPFAIDEWQHGRKLPLKRNVNYYDTLAYLDYVTFLMGANASNPLVLYEQGKIDVCYVNSYALARVQDENNPLSNELTSVPQLAISYIGMNVTMPPFDDANVRKSFALLLDYERLRDVTWNGSIAIARGILPPGMPGYNPNIPQRETSIARAKELLKESKYGENLPPIAAYGSGTLAILRDVAEEELGVTFEIRNFENYAEYLDALKQAEMPMYSTGWIADYPDPENFLDLLFRTGSQENHSLYSNPEVDRLLDEAATEEETEERWKLYRQAEQIIMEDMPVIPVYHDIDHILVKPYVEGLVLTPMGILDLSTVKLAR